MQCVMISYIENNINIILSNDVSMFSFQRRATFSTHSEDEKQL